MKKAKDPCKCCTRTYLSVCRNLAWKENWEKIKKIAALFSKKKDPK